LSPELLVFFTIPLLDEGPSPFFPHDHDHRQWQDESARPARVWGGNAAPEPLALDHGLHSVLDILPVEYCLRATSVPSPAPATVQDTPPSHHKQDGIRHAGCSQKAKHAELHSMIESQIRRAAEHGRLESRRPRADSTYRVQRECTRSRLSMPYGPFVDEWLVCFDSHEGDDEDSGNDEEVRAVKTLRSRISAFVMSATHHSRSRLANYEAGILPPPDLGRSYFCSRRPRSILKGHRNVMTLKSLRFGRCYRTWRKTLAHCKKAYLAKTSELHSDSRARLKNIESKPRRSTRGSSFLWRNILLPPCTLEQVSGIATLASPIV